MKTDVKRQLEAMHRRVDDNITECCQEILRVDVDAVLKDGCVREAARLLTDPVFGGRQLDFVQNRVKNVAMQLVVKMSNVMEKYRKERLRQRPLAKLNTEELDAVCSSEWHG